MIQICIALEYPPAENENLSEEDDSALVEGKPVREHVYEPNPSVNFSLIHLDIDPQNGKSAIPSRPSIGRRSEPLGCQLTTSCSAVLVGNYNFGPPTERHVDLPVLKLNDFGIAHIFSPQTRRNP